MSLATLIKRLQDIMRKDSGVDGDAQRLAQIVWLIFLKIFDYKEETAELDDDYVPVIPEGYRWRDWAIGESLKAQLTGDELLNFVNNILLPVLSGNEIKDESGKMVIPFDSTDERSMLVKSIIGASANYMKNGYLLREVINLFNEVDFSDTVETHEFNDMYEGLRGVLQTKISSDIQQAERTLNDDLALKVLKALFLLKYVKGFPSTLDNITRVMLTTLDTDFPAYRSDIQEALNKLVRQSYIEKGANEEYHYQTNEEKDIETEIKNEDLRPEATNEELKKIFRDEIFSDSKIKLSNYKIFSYGRMVDEVLDGRDSDMFIHFITPFDYCSLSLLLRTASVISRSS